MCLCTPLRCSLVGSHNFGGVADVWHTSSAISWRRRQRRWSCPSFGQKTTTRWCRYYEMLIVPLHLMMIMMMMMMMMMVVVMSLSSGSCTLGWSGLMMTMEKKNMLPVTGCRQTWECWIFTSGSTPYWSLSMLATLVWWWWWWWRWWWWWWWR